MRDRENMGHKNKVLKLYDTMMLNVIDIFLIISLIQYNYIELICSDRLPFNFHS